jgi:hypothetical protein
LELAKSQAKRCGVPLLPLLVLPHPIGGRSGKDVEKIVGSSIDQLFDMFTKLKEEIIPEEKIPRTLEIEGDDLFEASNNFFLTNMWSDGLPLIPPTQEKVRDMMAGTRLPGDHLVAVMEPKGTKATVEKIAINAVMAGCKAEYLPVVIAAIEAMVELEYNLKGLSTTTGAAAPLIIVNGPIIKKLGINAGTGCCGPGWRANATIGRAVRLIMQNVGGAIPVRIDKSTFGQPGKYTYCIAENELENPWDSFSMERGFSKDTNTVTVMGLGGPGIYVSFFSAKAGKDILKSIAWGMGAQRPIWMGEMICILNPEAARMIAEEGYTKDDIKEFLFAATAIPFPIFKEYSAIVPNQFGLPKKWFDLQLDKNMIPIFRRPEDIAVIVAGGPGKHILLLTSWIPGTRMVTKEIMG